MGTMSEWRRAAAAYDAKFEGIGHGPVHAVERARRRENGTLGQVPIDMFDAGRLAQWITSQGEDGLRTHNGIGVTYARVMHDWAVRYLIRCEPAPAPELADIDTC